MLFLLLSRSVIIHLQLDLQLQDEAGGDISSFITNGEWELLGKSLPTSFIIVIIIFFPFDGTKQKKTNFPWIFFLAGRNFLLAALQLFRFDQLLRNNRDRKIITQWRGGAKKTRNFTQTSMRKFHPLRTPARHRREYDRGKQTMKVVSVFFKGAIFFYLAESYQLTLGGRQL